MSHRFIPLVVLALGLPLLPGTASAETCFHKSYDKDGDGYALNSAPSVEIDYGNGLECQGNYVGERLDCNDSNRAVHPRTLELPNGIDDNCSGGVDEPRIVFRDSTAGMTENSVNLEVRVPGAREIQASNAGGLRYQIEVTRLSASKSDTRKELIYPAPPLTSGGFTVKAEGLMAGQVYKLRVHLLDSALARISSTPDYFAMTRPAQSDEISNARHRVVTRGLFQFQASRHGEIAYRGTVRANGLRFGADSNERWCSEFYSWVVSPSAPDLEGIGLIDDLRDEFTANHGWQQVTDYRKRGLLPGEYLAFDNDGPAEKDHSGMFLAYDVDANKVYSLEGNNDNEVLVVTRELSEIAGLGYFTNELIE